MQPAGGVPETTSGGCQAWGVVVGRKKNASKVRDRAGPARSGLSVRLRVIACRSAGAA